MVCASLEKPDGRESRVRPAMWEVELPDANPGLGGTANGSGSTTPSGCVGVTPGKRPVVL